MTGRWFNLKFKDTPLLIPYADFDAAVLMSKICDCISSSPYDTIHRPCNRSISVSLQKVHEMGQGTAINYELLILWLLTKNRDTKKKSSGAVIQLYISTKEK